VLLPDPTTDRSPSGATEADESTVACEEVSFLSGGSRCEGWLFRPVGAGPYPCVVMGHGFGAIRTAGLPAFARRFAAAGIAVLVFDYRHLGTSQGQPRGLIDIGRQRADYRAAVTYARSLDDVDGERIGLWGTSFSGGHVVTVAAEDPRIAAVVAMNPFVDGPPTVRATIRAAGMRNAAALGGKWAKDEIRRLRRRRPHLVALVGPPGSVAVFTTPDADAGYTPDPARTPRRAPRTPRTRSPLPDRPLRPLRRPLVRTRRRRPDPVLGAGPAPATAPLMLGHQDLWLLRSPTSGIRCGRTPQMPSSERSCRPHVRRRRPRRDAGGDVGWGVQESNLRPLACRASALAD
jgi:fermentation-respiration switch protein FrsA (DUF1100 family)